jgi:beta-galactosidase
MPLRSLMNTYPANFHQRFGSVVSLTLGFLLLNVPAFSGQRATISLDGQWRIAESVSGQTVPTAFSRTVSVPGLVNLARPPFEKVDAFFSREHLANRIRAKLAPEDWLTNYWMGKVEQDRDYFWYQKKFNAPAQRDVALLKINKAQFGTAVWLNGEKIGEYAGCFTASYFPLNKNIRWGGENTLIIRIGAHPAVLPDTYPTGSDFEKIKWTPGIYDSVSVIYCDNPLIESVQVAPQISSNEIIVQTTVRNTSEAASSTTLSHSVKTWKGGKRVSNAEPVKVAVPAGETNVVTQRIAVPDARWWTPEDPFLYVLESSTAGDSVRTRFGMREFRFDGPARRALLNGKPYFLRGSNITLHRFFEDPLCGDLPWREKWVRKLLGELPKQMHWNYFRFCIGPVPDRWLEICDEEGLLIQNEFFVWTGGPGWYKGYSRKHDPEEMIRQYGDWMRDNWNHPSVVVWDANNETKDDIFGEKIIPAVRHLDLSRRPWENSYNPPVADIDPVEDHPYLMIGGGSGKLQFKMSDLESKDGKPRKGALPSESHAPLINEYGWLWLNRDGTPTRLTEKLYPQLMGTTNTTARQRLDLYSYLLAGKTEFWRAHRHYAGIVHFVYLTCSYPGVYTADHFQDVRQLRLDAAFADYLGEAFKPLGVYLNFFQPELKAASAQEFKIMLVNDYDHPVKGTVVLTLESSKGKVLARAEAPFQMAALGDAAVKLPLNVPTGDGACVLRARAVPGGGLPDTFSRRWVKVN